MCFYKGNCILENPYPSSCASWRRHADEGRGGGSTLSGCCSRRGCGRLRVACRRRLGAVGRGGCLLCLWRSGEWIRSW